MSLVLIPDGPGVTVEVSDGQQGLPSAPRGTGALVGQFVSGPTTRAGLALTKEQARLIWGEPDDDFPGNLSLDDVYSEYSPPMMCARVTDGLALQAQASLWDRSPSRSFSKLGGFGADREPLATAKAHNVGRWGGRKKVIVGTLPAVATDIASASTANLGAATQVGITLLETDQLAGAFIEFEGDTGGPYEILSNTAAGVITILGEFSIALQAATGSGAIDGQFRVTLDHDKELSVVIGPDNVLGEKFSVTAVRKFTKNSGWEVVSQYDNLQLAEGDDRPWTTVVPEGEDSRFQIEIDTDYSGETVEAMLPCNFSEVPTTLATNVLTFQWYRWVKTAGLGNGYLSAISPVSSTSVEPHVYELTFTAALVFTVAVIWPDGTQQTLSAAGAVGAEFNPEHPQLSKFTIVAGGTAFDATTRMTIRVNPLPHDLYAREAYIYPIAVTADGNAGRRLRIVSNTYNTVSIRSDLLFSSYGSSVGAAASVTGTVDLTAVSMAAASTLILTPDGHTAVTLTSAGSGPGAAAIAAELTALDTGSKFIFEASGVYLKISVRGSYGSQSSLLVGAGTANAALGFVDNSTTYGTDAVPFRIEARWPMWGGYDGAAPASARYQLAMDLSDSYFKCHLNTNLGGVLLAMPGVTTDMASGDDAMAAALAFCEKNGWFYLAEFAESLEAVASQGEAAVADLMDNHAESDHRRWLFPSRLKYQNVLKTALVTRSCSGQVIGIRARLANQGVDGERGLHIAAANNNEQGRMSPRAKGLPDGLGRNWVPPLKLLNDHGIVAILWEGPDIYMWGNRMYSRGRTPQGNRYTITERDVYYHVARDLFVTARPYVFKSISARRLGEIQVGLREKMKKYHLDGWFSDDGGARAGFEQQVQVEVPLSLNPASELLEGRVRARITFTPRPALESLTINLAPTQVTTT
jgi:hypothetical protein